MSRAHDLSWIKCSIQSGFVHGLSPFAATSIHVKGEKMKRENNPTVCAHFVSHNMWLPREETEALDAYIEERVPQLGNNNQALSDLYFLWSL